MDSEGSYEGPPLQRRAGRFKFKDSFVKATKGSCNSNRGSLNPQQIVSPGGTVAEALETSMQRSSNGMQRSS